MSEDLLFAHLKVLDVGSWIAAPVATTMLADFGAQVIKVEAPGIGDGYRLFSESAGAPDSAVNFAWQMDARNKRSITLNLKSQAGRDLLYQLVADADVFVTNHMPQFREDWGLGYTHLSQLNPRLIYASLTAYGENGPERNREGFDLVAYWARSGLMELVHAPDADPAPALPGMGDHPTAVTVYAGIVTALLRRIRSGEGSYVHTSLLANGVWSASCVAQAAFADGEFNRYRKMSRHMYTRLMYETRDQRWLQFTMVRTEHETDLLFAVLGVPELLVDARFIDQQARLDNGDQLVKLLRPVIRTRDAQAWMDDFNAAGVPVGLVGEVERLPQDQQVVANGMLLEGGESGMQAVIKHPINIAGMPTQSVQRAPDRGEHTEQVLAELGLTRAEIDVLKDTGVV